MGGGGGIGGTIESVFDGSLGKNIGQGEFAAERYNIDRGAFDPNAEERSFTQMLQDRAAGRGPSAAEMQLQAGAGLAAQNANALAATQHGISPGLAARMSQQSSAQAMQGANQQAGILRAQEQAQSIGELGGVLENQRQARMNREALGVQQQTGLNSVNQAGFDNSQNRRGSMINSLGGSLAQMAAMSRGGLVQNYAMGGIANQALQGEFARMLSSMGSGGGTMMKEQEQGKGLGQALMSGQKMLNQPPTGTAMAGGPMDGGLPPGILPEEHAGMAEMLPMAQALLASGGAMVPGQAKVEGDSEANDTVPAMLSPGEMVIPRSVVADGAGAISSFAQAILKRGKA